MRFGSFNEILGHYAGLSPDAEALRYGEKTITYGELAKLTADRAEHLRKSGKKSVGILCDGTADCVIEIFAAVSAGLRVVMLDGAAPTDTLRDLIEYTEADALWGDDELCAELEPYLKQNAEACAGDILFFTSGTTERAKAVVLTEKSLSASAYNGGAVLPLSPGDTLMCMLPLNHVFGFVCGLLWGLSCGASVALGRGARHYIDDCAFYKPTAVSLVPSLVAFLIKNGLLNPELELILIGAGDCPAELIAAAKNTGARVSFGYGLTETSSGVALSVGGDPYAMDICPDDTVTIAEDGEILITAPTCMMKGYYKRENDTETVLRGGVLFTGDLGFLDDSGRLHVTGRKKEILVLPDGTKIFLPEYEKSVAAAIGSRDFAVCEKGGEVILVLHGAKEEKDEIVKKLSAAMALLPRGQQIRDIIFTLDPLPRTASGKIKRWEVLTRDRK